MVASSRTLLSDLVCVYARIYVWRNMLQICKIIFLIQIETKELCDEMIQIIILRYSTKILFQNFDEEM
jgi:hypothetical protein